MKWMVYNVVILIFKAQSITKKAADSQALKTACIHKMHQVARMLGVK